MTMQEMMSLTVEEIDLILKDQLELYTEEEIRDIRRWRSFLVSQEEDNNEKESKKDYNENDYEVKALKCPKCAGLNDAANTRCIYCDYVFQEENEPVKSDNVNQSINISELFTSIVMSIVSFVLTSIIRFNVHAEVDLTPSAWSHHWGMAVPSDIKPVVMVVPVIFTLITIVKTVMSSKMREKEKGVSYVIAVASLIASIAIVNWRYEI